MSGCYCGSIRGGPVAEAILAQTAELALTAETLQDVAQLSSGAIQVIEPGTETLVFDGVGAAFGTALTADLPNNRIIVNTTGFYLIHHTIRWGAGSVAATQRESSFSVNGTIPGNRNIQPYGLGELMYSNVNFRALTAGDFMTLQATHNDPGNISVTNRVYTIIRIR